jgi:hypothetical protein
MLYHRPPDQLRAEGKVQLCDFHWSPGRPDGDLEEDDDMVVQRYYHPTQDHQRHHREDDDEDLGRDRSRFRGRDLFWLSFPLL